jgi:gliding motility-associated-like protein
VSPPIVTEILPFMEIPKFEVITKPTTCEQAIGQAELIPSKEYEIETIDWYYSPVEIPIEDFDSENVYASGIRLSDLPKGYYKVAVTTTKQCYNEGLLRIEPDIIIFNGVSQNGDGMNDIFEIACIQDFPNNHVKIFNRAGTLVYEIHGYNNADVYFDGISNKGLNVLGTRLPEGTYFYIIDRGDGSKPHTGYLELLR